jgi:hypothetical protein
MTGNDPASDRKPARAGHRVAIFAILGTIAVALVAAVALIVMDGRTQVAYPPDSPEAALHRYLDAWDQGDVDRAWSALSTRAQSLLRYATFQSSQAWLGDEAIRVWIGDSRSDEPDRVVLELTVERSSDGPLGVTRDRLQRRVSLVREGDTWLLDTALTRPFEW